MYVYSAKSNSFYPLSLQEDYLATNTWPEDGIEVKESVYDEFSNPPDGKMRVSGKDGLPAWADVTPPSQEDLVIVALQKRENLLADASVKLAPLQDAFDLGIATDDEKSRLNEIKKYRVLLNRLDLKSPSSVTWPQIPYEE
ncbi:TPA: tail fiber assembly protein [Enterobacter asburiae]|nr:tail fiber assembly protein [Enterobacter asburiae]